MYKGKRRLAARLLSIVLAAGMSISGVSVGALAAEASDASAEQETVIEQAAAEEQEVVPEAEDEQEEIAEAETEEPAEPEAEEVSEEPETVEEVSAEPDAEAEITEETEEDAEAEAAEQAADAEEEIVSATVEGEVDTVEDTSKNAAPENGWYTDEYGDKFYYIDGEKVCDTIIEIDGDLYGFDESGYLYRNEGFYIWSDEDNQSYSYYAREDGSLVVNSWYQLDWEDTQRYFGEGGREAIGFAEIDGTLYYFEEYSGLSEGGVYYDDDGNMYIVDKNGVATLAEAQDGWVETEDGNKSYLIDGEAVRDKVMEIDGDYYGFNENGLMRRDEVFRLSIEEYGEENVYCAGADGKLIANAWYEEEFTDYHDEVYTDRYYFGEDRKAVKGVHEIDGNLYCFDDYNGILLTEQFFEDEQGNRYYAGSDGVGTLVVATDGWYQHPDGNWSYFRDGAPVEGEVLKIGSYYYGFDFDGIMYADTDFRIYYGEDVICYRAKADGSLYVNAWVKDGDDWYYYFGDGKAKGGLQNVGGTMYVFSYNGRMRTNFTYTAPNGDKYTVGSDGVARKATAAKDGWNLIDGDYYYRENGKFITNQVRKIGGTYYGFSYSGRMYDDTYFWIYDSKADRDYEYRAKAGGALYVNAWYKEEGYDAWFYYGGDGRLATGWKQIGGAWYYFDEGGEMQTGWQDLDGKSYYFKESGAMATGWQSFDSEWYYFDSNGAIVKGWKQIGGKWYYFDDDGVMQTGLQKLDGKNYFFNGSGAMVTGWQSVDGKWYYFEGSGAMKTGWLQTGGKWYYFDGEGVMQTGLQKIGGTTYFFNGSGAMATGWQSVDGKWYYFQGSGAMKTGWLQTGGKWYYFDGEGVMQTGLQKIGGATYFFNGSGAMATGWQSADGKWYYFEGSGAAAVKKWVGDYYLGEDGVMATNTWISGYYVGSDGKWIPGYKEAN